METYNGGLKEIREQVETENVVWDVVDFELSDLIRGCREGLLETIDHGTLPPGDDGTPAADDFIPGAFTRMRRRPDRVVDGGGLRRRGGRRERSLHPRRLLRRRRISRQARPAARPARDSRMGADRRWRGAAARSTPRSRPKTGSTGRSRSWTRSRTTSSGGRRARTRYVLLDSDEVVLTSVWNGRMYRPIVEDGKPYAILWDGQIWDIDSWGIPKGSDNLHKAMRLHSLRHGHGAARGADEIHLLRSGESCPPWRRSPRKPSRTCPPRPRTSPAPCRRTPRGGPRNHVAADPEIRGVAGERRTRPRRLGPLSRHGTGQHFFAVHMT